MASWKDNDSGQPKPRRPKPAAAPSRAKPASSWLGGVKPSRSRDGNDREWQQDRDQRGRLHGKRLGGLGLMGLALALIVLFVYVVIVKPTAPEVWLVADQPREVGRAALLAGGDYPEHLRDTGEKASPRERLSELSDAAAQDKDNPKPRAVLVTGHGVVRGDEPWLLFGDTEMRVADLVKGAGGATLIALDACRGRVRWEEGQLCNLFPAAVRKTLETTNPAVAVVLPCDNGQQDWRLWPQVGRGFSRRFFEALAGQHGASRRRLRELGMWRTITPGTLQEAVANSVADRSASYAELIQTANTIPGDAASKFVVVSLPRPEFPKIALNELNDRLDECDKIREQLVKRVGAGARGRSPLLLARAWFDLSELQTAATSGDAEAYDEIRRRLKDSLERLATPGDGGRSPSLTASHDPGYETWKKLCEAENGSARQVLPDLRKFAGETPFRAWRPAEARYASLLAENVNWEADPSKAVRLALQVRRLSEELANWPDPRVHALLRDRLEMLESSRREHDDALILGVPDLPTKMKRQYDDLKEAFTDQQRDFDVTDLILDMGPWAGEWWLDEFQRAMFTAEALAEEASKGPLDNLNKVHGLHTQAAKKSAILHEAVAAALDQSQARTENLSPAASTPEKLREDFDAARRPSGKEGVRFALIHALRVVENPAMAPPEAKELHKLLSNQPDEQPAKANDGLHKAAAERSGTYAKRLREEVVAVGGHPVSWMTLKQPEEGDSNGSHLEWYTEFGDAVRDEVERLAEAFDTAGDTADPPANQSGQTLAASSIEQRRAAWLIARKRAPAALPEVDPFWAYCKKQQQVWLAKRAIEDFWGEGQPGSTTEFPFAELALAYCPGDSAVSQLVESATAAAQALESATVTLKSPVEDGGEATVVLKSSSAESMPEGKAAFSAAGSANSLQFDKSARSELEVTERGPNGDATVTAPEQKPLPSSAVWTLRYRGHRVEGKVELAGTKAAALTVRHEPTPRSRLRPSVTVHGDQRKQVDVVIIFDASDSMGDEQPEKDGFKTRRIEGAKAKLKNLLDRMAEETESPKSSNARFRVALVVYGHRSAWKIDENKYVIGMDATMNHLPVTWLDWSPRLHPSADVEVVLDLTDLDSSNTADSIYRGKIGPLKPWGSTPLYLAMSEALKLFERSAAERHLIVLTDGVNNVEDAWDEDWPIRPQVPLLFSEYNEPGDQLSDDLANALSEGRCPKVTVIAYGSEFVKKSEVEGAGTPIGSFNWLKDNEQIDAVVARAANTAELEETIDQWFDETVKRPLFGVGPSGTAVDAETNFENPWTAPNATTWPAGDYQVGTGGLDKNAVKPVFLEGWEALHLELNKSDSPQLEFWSYERARSSTTHGFAGDAFLYESDDDRYVPFRRHTSSQRISWRAAALQQTFGQTDPRGWRRFHVLLEQTDPTQQSVAPEVVWAEIEPLDDRQLPIEGGPVYRGSDVKCVYGRNAPVLEWIVEDWPPNAPNARLKLWAAFSGETATIELGAGALRVPVSGHGTVARGEGRWAYEWTQSDKRYALNLTAKGEHARETILRIDPAIEYESARHRYAPEEESVVHEYVFKTPPGSDLEVQVYSVSELKKSGWTLSGDGGGDGALVFPDRSGASR